MNNNILDQIIKRLGEAMCKLQEQQNIIQQQEKQIKLLEARLAQTSILLNCQH